MIPIKTRCDKTESSVFGFQSWPDSFPKNLDQLSFPTKMLMIREEGLLLVSDSGNNRVLGVDSQTGRIRYSIGSGECGFRDGGFNEAEFDWPQGLAYDNETRTVFIADTFNNLIRAADLTTGRVTRVCGIPNKQKSSLIGQYDYVGGKPALEQGISSPWDICLVRREKHKFLMIASAGTHQIWLYLLPNSVDLNWWKSTPRIEPGRLFCVAGNGRERNKNNSYPMQASFAQPSGICLGPNDSLFVADSESSTIRVVSLKDGSVKGLVGGDPSQPDNLFAYGDVDGVGHEARLQHPLDVEFYLDDETEYLLVADTYNNCVKKIDIQKKKVDKLVPTDDNITLNEPNCVCVGDSGRMIFIADTNNHSIKMVDNFDIKRNQIEIKEFEIGFSDAKRTTSEQKQTTGEMEVYVRFKFKLNLNGENSWKITTHGDSNTQIIEGSFKKSDILFPDAYRLNGFRLNRSSDIESIELNFNLIYCESNESSCKMCRTRRVLNRKEIEAIMTSNNNIIIDIIE